MSDKPSYFDKRSEFWKRHWELARSYEEFLAGEPDHAAKWAAMEKALSGLPADRCERLSGCSRKMMVLVYAGTWCGDCARQSPILRQLAGACERTEIRFIDRDLSEELQDELRLLGALRVPVAVFLSEDFHELGRFGDRLLFAYRRKAQRELGEACDAGILPPSAEDLSTERDEWLDIFERMLLMLRLAPPLRRRYED